MSCYKSIVSPANYLSLKCLAVCGLWKQDVSCYDLNSRLCQVVVGSAQHKYTLCSAFVGYNAGEGLAERKVLFTVCRAVRS